MKLVSFCKTADFLFKILTLVIHEKGTYILNFRGTILIRSKAC